MARRRLISTTLVVVCAAGALSAVPASAAAAPASCNVLDLSPQFAKDGTALCVGTHKERIDQPATGVNVFLTTNSGKTWQRRTATGLPFTTDSQWRQVVFSASYASDKTIYVQERSGGLYSTTDGGATFSVADPLAISGDDLPNLTAVRSAAGLPAGSPLSAVAYAGTVPALLSPPVHQPVPGSGPLQAKSFIIPRSFPDRPGYLVSLVPSVVERTAAYKVFLCEATFTCTTELASVQPGWRILAAELVGPAQRLVVVAHATFGADAGKVAAWRASTDGRKLERYAALESVLRPVGRYIRSVGLAGLRSGELVVLLDHSGADLRTIPARQLFMSSRGGTAWRRVAYRLSAFQKGTRGQLPERDIYTASYNASRVWVSPADRLFLVGGSGVHSVSTLFCSGNGTLWRPTC